jgi:MoxR-like ATPase
VPQPFIVIATQIPYGFEGTSQLTEVQSDRFMFRAWSGYLDRAQESEVLANIDFIDRLDVNPVASLKEIASAREAVRTIFVSDGIRDYITMIADSLRRNPDVFVAPSSRATGALYKGARAIAFMRGRDYAIPDDVKMLAMPVLEHRMRVKPEAEIDGVTALSLVERVMKEIPVPKAD